MGAPAARYTWVMDRDVLKQKLEDARYKAEGALSAWHALDEDRRRIIIRLSAMGSVLVALLLVGAAFFWRPFADRPRDYQQARTVSDASRSMADRVRLRLAGRPEFDGITVTAVATTGDENEFLMVYGRAPSQEAMDELRETVDAIAPGVRVDWRITVASPAGALDPDG